jgi:hypothetical protein
MKSEWVMFGARFSGPELPLSEPPNPYRNPSRRKTKAKTAAHAVTLRAPSPLKRSRSNAPPPSAFSACTFAPCASAT